MTRLYVICEGQTEATFAQELLTPHFRPRGIYLTPTVIGRSGQKGGNVSYARLLARVRPLLLSGHKPYCTTFIDYYGLPIDFPGKRAATSRDLEDKLKTVCSATRVELVKDVGENVMCRFVPYVQMHEFEGLLFSDPVNFAKGIDMPELQAAFSNIRDAFPSPEHINNNPQTAPSKRVQDEFPRNVRYEKPIMGTLAALEIGLPKIRQECPLFNAWLCKLESLPPLPA